jgi:general secretion pathway protein E/type IV pilus assembly protein PilB
LREGIFAWRKSGTQTGGTAGRGHAPRPRSRSPRIRRKAAGANDVTSNDDYVVEVLLEEGLVTAEQIEKTRQGRVAEGQSALDKLIADKSVQEKDVLAVLAARFGMEMISLIDQDIPAEVITSVSPEVARKYKIVPVYKSENSLTVAIGDPLDVDTLDNLRYLLKSHIDGVVAAPAEIKVALERYYATESTMETMLEQMTEGTVEMGTSSGENALVDAADVTDSDVPIIKLVSLIIHEAHRNRASDIHLEPMEKRFRVRYRIDGVLHEVDSPPKRLQSAIISRVKIMANMKIAEKRIPQDGRIQVTIRGRELDLRVSTVPSCHGESVVMRILDKQNLALGLPKLGFLADDQELFQRLITLPDGILLVTGPTGSGKTTTLYACLHYINRPDRKIITVEDPVEYQMSGINQVHVRDDIGLTFASALRSILRQAPNIVMIGEIRDYETARIATEASLTGHLVFSTLHTNDAPSAITRLLDIGVKPFLVASSVRAVMAQRLVRTICEGCKEEHKPTVTELRLLGATAKEIAHIQFFAGRGCTKCALTGYSGRTGIFEILVITDEIQHMIFEKISASDLRIRGRELGMRTLREDGMRKVIAGITTLEEVLRVTMGDES